MSTSRQQLTTGKQEFVLPLLARLPQSCVSKNTQAKKSTPAGMIAKKFNACERRMHAGLVGKIFNVCGKRKSGKRRVSIFSKS